MSDVPPPPLPGSQKPMGDSAGMRMVLPVGRSGFAIAAGYLGLLSVLIIPAPLALVFGILAIRDIKKSANDEHPKHGMGRAIFGLVMGAIGSIIIVIGLLGLLAG